MKRLTGVVMAGTLLALIVLNASRLQAQGTNTLEDLIEKFQLLTSDQGELAERLAAMETAVASANVLAGIPIQDENRCTTYHAADYPYPASLEAQIVAELKGKFYSPYTGETFTRAVEVDIEHIVARSEAHDSGLCAADIFTRRAFASDMLNLTLAEPGCESKSESGKRRGGMVTADEPVLVCKPGRGGQAQIRLVDGCERGGGRAQRAWLLSFLRNGV